MDKEKIIRKTMAQIKYKDQIIDFLNWYKDINDDGCTCHFNYKIITKDKISNVINNKIKICDNLFISINNFCDDIYNPIIYWVCSLDETTLYIMDWRSLKKYIPVWIIDEMKEDMFIEKFKKSKVFICCELLNEINESMEITQEIMDKISQVFPGGRATFDDGAFCVRPILIKNIDDLVKCIKEYENENPVRSALVLANFWKRYRENIDIFEDQYWYFVDGVNWEQYIETHKGMIGYLISSFEWNGLRTSEDFDKMIEVLKEILEGDTNE